jgi:hypothetical protein
MPAKRFRSLVLLLLVLSGCRKAKAPAPPAPAAPVARVASKVLKVGLTGVPAGFTAVPGAVDHLRLTSSDDGVITIGRGTGTDLNAAVRAEEARVHGLGGRFLGSVELLCQFGQAWLTRSQPPGATEEIRIFLVVPKARPFVITSAYPAAGASLRRLNQALFVLKNLQTLP